MEHLILSQLLIPSVEEILLCDNIWNRLFFLTYYFFMFNISQSKIWIFFFILPARETYTQIRQNSYSGAYS